MNWRGRVDERTIRELACFKRSADHRSPDCLTALGLVAILPTLEVFMPSGTGEPLTSSYARPHSVSALWFLFPPIHAPAICRCRPGA